MVNKKYLNTSLSIDPLWYEQLSWSPYHYCGNDPINGKDGSGKEVYAIGSGANEGIDYINQEIKSFSISINNETGLLSASRKNVKADYNNFIAESILYDAIADKKISLKLDFTTSNTMNDINGFLQMVVGGMYGGSKINENGTVSALQGINIVHFKRINSERIGKSIIHEFLEGYFGAKNQPGTTYPVSYEQSHNSAMSVFNVFGNFDLSGSRSVNRNVTINVNGIDLYTLPSQIVRQIQENQNR